MRLNNKKEIKDRVVKARSTLRDKLRHSAADPSIVDGIDDSVLLEHFLPETYDEIAQMTISAKGKLDKDKKTSGIRSSVVKINEETAKLYSLRHNQIASIATSDCKKVYECTISVIPNEYNHNDDNSRLENNSIILTFFLKAQFREYNNGENKCFLVVPRSFIFLNPTTQRASEIRDRSISILEKTYEELKKYSPQYIEIRHLATGATMLKPFSQVKSEKSLPNGADIRLTYYQRVILNLSDNSTNNESILHDKIDRVTYNPDSFISEEKYAVSKVEKRGRKSEISFSVPANSGDENGPLDNVLNNGKVISDEKWKEHKVVTSKSSSGADHFDYNVKVTGKFEGEKIEIDVVRPEYKKLQLIPIYSEYIRKRSWKEKLSDYLVGSSDLCLSAIRPYSVDDDRDIVRLSRDNMKLLGIEETDRVRIVYKNEMRYATVLAIDSIDSIKAQNIMFSDADMDTIIGIPSPLRRDLGVHDVETEVFVYRDTEFIFKKNLNIQLLPILALIFTVFQINMYLWLQISICIIMTPIIMILSLSQERQKVKELNEGVPTRKKRRRKK